MLIFENLWRDEEPRLPRAELDASWKQDNGHNVSPCVTVTVQQHNENMQIVGARRRWLLIVFDLAIGMVDGTY